MATFWTGRGAPSGVETDEPCLPDLPNSCKIVIMWRYVSW